LLARLDPRAREGLFKLSPAKRYPVRTVLLRQGDDATRHAFVFREVRPRGAPCVKITARLPNGTQSLLGIRLCGDIVGELAALHGSPRTATAITCSEVVAHVVSGDDLKSFLDRYPDAWTAVSNTIADRLAWANQRRLDFTGYPVPVRLARILLCLSDQHGFPVEEGRALGVTLSHEELGMLIGAGRDAVGQAVAKLKRVQFIKSSYRAIIITDLSGLRAYAESDD
jgi:CRP-like cAMP-binding protein